MMRLDYKLHTVDYFGKSIVRQLSDFIGKLRFKDSENLRDIYHTCLCQLRLALFNSTFPGALVRSRLEVIAHTTTVDMRL